MPFPAVLIQQTRAREQNVREPPTRSLFWNKSRAFLLGPVGPRLRNCHHFVPHAGRSRPNALFSVESLIDHHCLLSLAVPHLWNDNLVSHGLVVCTLVVDPDAIFGLRSCHCSRLGEAVEGSRRLLLGQDAAQAAAQGHGRCRIFFATKIKDAKRPAARLTTGVPSVTRAAF